MSWPAGGPGSCPDPARPCEQLKTEQPWEHGTCSSLQSSCMHSTTREGRRHSLLPISQYPLAFTSNNWVNLCASAALRGTRLSSHVKLSGG